MALTDIERFLDQLGDEARAIAMQYFRTDIDVETKPDATPVTTADRAIERRLRELIASRFPSHTLVGEEGGGRIAEGVSWVIDPIDGTKSFVTGLPLFGTLVAMLENRRPVCGMIEAPAMRERWIGGIDHASRNGEPCTVSACAHLRDARLCSTDSRMFSGEAERAFARLAREVRVTRFGTDCYGYAMLVSGHVDLVVEDGLQIHDVMAIIPVIQGCRWHRHDMGRRSYRRKLRREHHCGRDALAARRGVSLARPAARVERLVAAHLSSRLKRGAELLPLSTPTLAAAPAD